MCHATRSVNWMARPRAPLVPNFTPVLPINSEIVVPHSAAQQTEGPALTSTPAEGGDPPHPYPRLQAKERSMPSHPGAGRPLIILRNVLPENHFRWTRKILRMEASAPPPQPSPSVSPESPAPNPRARFTLPSEFLVIPKSFVLTGSQPDLPPSGALLLARCALLISGIILGIRRRETLELRFSSPLRSRRRHASCRRRGLAAAGCGISNPKFNFH